MTLDITLDDLTAKLGQYKRIGNEYAFQCPICQDKGKDNMMYNPKKGVVWCHADSTHAPALLSEIMKEKQPPPPIDGIPQWKLEQEAYFEYQDECNQYLLNNQKALDYLKEYTYINKKTVEVCGIGYDSEDNKWVFPVYNYCFGLVGYEYRAADLEHKQVWKEKDTPAVMSLVYGSQRSDILYITEGFKDAYILAQWMGYPENSTIMTPSNGVATIEKCITEIPFGNFKEIRLCLDNDKAGQTVTAKLLAKYPFMIDKTPQPTEGKDIGDLYKELVINE